MAALMLAGCGSDISEAGNSGAVNPEAGNQGVVNSEAGNLGVINSGDEESGREVSGNTVSEEHGLENITADAEVIKVSYSGEVSDEWISSLSSASTDLFAQTIAEEGDGKNILISPTSMMMAFGMLENGAKGETLSQIENSIGGGVSCEDMNEIMYALSEHLSDAEEVSWNVANSVWFKDGCGWEVLPEFASAAKSYYGADIWRAPFDDTTVGDINSWVKDQTHDMIPEIIDHIPDEAKMYLINALAFEGEWQNEYEEDRISEDRSFTNYDGSKGNVTYLCSNEDLYFELGGGLGFVRPYKGGEFSFVGILPEEGVGVEDYVRQIAADSADFAGAVRNAKTYGGDIRVMIPEFSMDYDASMKQVLTDLGMEVPFDKTSSDLTGLMRSNADGYQVWIDDVLHRTHIEVDRMGTRAAAVTAIAVLGCDAVAEYEEPIDIFLTRPFVYAIVDNETGLPVFIGCVNSL